MDPVGVVERVGATHEPHQVIGIVEVERSPGDFLFEVRRGTRIVRQRPDLVTRGVQPAVDEASGVTVGAGVDVCGGHDWVLGYATEMAPRTCSSMSVAACDSADG